MCWPELPYDLWKSTKDTLHLWMQIVGKVKLAYNPFLNQWWGVAFFPTALGMTTGRIYYKQIIFEVFFNFYSHILFVYTSTGREAMIPLHGMYVAEFYDKFIKTLHNLNIEIQITPFPTELPNAIPFAEDTIHNMYDDDAVARWWKIQLQTSHLLDIYRSDFRGKSSPLQFFWGSFDLNVTRFSGKLLSYKTDWPNGYKFMRYAENEENFSCGFWPGDDRYPHPAFYAYIYPAQKDSEQIFTTTNYAFFEKNLSEWILPYEDVSKSTSPEKEILCFFSTTYEALAKYAGWDIEKLKNPIPKNVKDNNLLTK